MGNYYGGVAAETAVTRTRFEASYFNDSRFRGFLVTVVLVGLYFLGFVLRLDNIFQRSIFHPDIWYYHG